MYPTVKGERSLAEPFATLRREMDQVFDSFFGSGGGNGNGLARGTWRAPLSLWEDDGHYYLEVELPGVQAADLNLTLERGRLHITAERKAPEENREYWHNEHRYGRMERFVTLPELVDPEAIEAELESGILHVKLNKKPEAQPRRIEIKSG